jgi:hypothetical protein
LGWISDETGRALLRSGSGFATAMQLLMSEPVHPA